MALRIQSDRLTAEISPDGAELRRLTDAAGRDWLWDGDPTFWSGRAPILFPIVGTLGGDRFRWHGREYTLPRHGFARRRGFALVDHDADGLVLRLDADDATRAVWPFDFTLDMIFTVRGATLDSIRRCAGRYPVRRARRTTSSASKSPSPPRFAG
ncbi:aldose epimerase family protein [Sphingomonas sp. SRS2]|uniref:aldose epimerase family protein n=1 Tax=Sphingomonas sp. SRS2 TaxID=133190 RepID=UPI000B1F445C